MRHISDTPAIAPGREPRGSEVFVLFLSGDATVLTGGELVNEREGLILRHCGKIIWIEKSPGSRERRAIDGGNLLSHKERVEVSVV